MRLIVKQNGRASSEFQFDEGPIRIGRRSDNHVVLRDRAVSKEHAVLYSTEDAKWMVEDLESANKTYLNDETIHKAELRSGDCFRIGDFTIEVKLGEDGAGDETNEAGDKTKEAGDKTIGGADTLQLEATLATPPHEIIVRKPDAGHAPAMRLHAKRLMEFSQATEIISGSKNLEELLGALLTVLLKQFEAFHCWCALREQPSGPVTYHAGKRRDGKSVELSDLTLQDKIGQAVERGQSMVLPRVSAKIEEKARIRSAMIAAIMRPTGCFGVLYVDNAMMHDHYSLADLDYLMLVAIHTGAVLKNLLNL